MKFVVFALSVAASLTALTPAFADQYDARSGNPTTTYYVCNHDAHYAINNRAKLIASGAPVWTNNSDGTVTLGRTQDIYLQTQRLVTPEWRSLSTDPRFCQN